MANPAVSYIFANSTTADATQVNQNFTDLINGITDGTKDLSISALTCAGTATLNGNTVVGSSSSDTLTISAVLASSIGLGTTFSYDVGSATVGLKSLYFGSDDSAAKSVRLIAPTVASSYTLKLPTGVPAASGYALVGTTGGVLSFAQHGVVPTIQKFTATGTTTGYLFTISTSSTVAVNDTYTNNGQTFTVLGALTAQSGQVLFTSATGAPAASGNLLVGVGSGTGTIAFTSSVALATYTTHTGPTPLYIKVRMVGGGGGGGGSATASATSGNTGTLTAFGAGMLSASGGGGGSSGGSGGAGGAASRGTVTVGTAIAGAGGTGCINTAAQMSGPAGASSALGGGGQGVFAATGGNAATNSGSGGAGGGFGTGGGYAGAAGGAGGYVEAIITSPSTTYPYLVGTGGLGGAGGAGNSNAGGVGADGYIEVTEYYQ